MKTYKKPSEFSAATIAAFKAILNIVTGNSGGNARGTNAADFQITRSDVTQVASGASSFIASGEYNKVTQQAGFASGSTNRIDEVIERDIHAVTGSANGIGNQVLAPYSTANGANCKVDGQISNAAGNSTMCSANDSTAGGNRSVAGRRLYDISSHGIDTDGDVGTKPFVIVADGEGDITSFFPNLLTNATAGNVTTRYGAGATADAKGNVYPSGMTVAVWTGDVPTTVNDLKWALHVFCVLKGTSEPNMDYFKILKATYTAGSGTKIYYDGAAEAWAGAIEAIYSSTAPTVLVGGKKCGNGQRVDGFKCSTYGSASRANGYKTRAWNDNAEASGQSTEASGVNSRAFGLQSKAARANQSAYSVGIYAVVGDMQKSEIAYNHACNGTGWFEINLIKECEDETVYNFESMVSGVQVSGTAGTAGDSFAYKFTGLVQRSGATYIVIGTPVRTLIGRSAGMTGDGLTTGVRCTWMAPDSSKNTIMLRYDGLANTLFIVMANTIFQEVKF